MKKIAAKIRLAYDFMTFIVFTVPKTLFDICADISRSRAEYAVIAARMNDPVSARRDMFPLGQQPHDRAEHFLHIDDPSAYIGEEGYTAPTHFLPEPQKTRPQNESAIRLPLADFIRGDHLATPKNPIPKGAENNINWNDWPTNLPPQSPKELADEQSYQDFKKSNPDFTLNTTINTSGLDPESQRYIPRERWLDRQREI